MDSIFNQECDERAIMAETIVLDWIDRHWKQFEEMVTFLKPELGERRSPFLQIVSNVYRSNLKR
jgi:hypothetical protein